MIRKFLGLTLFGLIALFLIPADAFAENEAYEPLTDWYAFEDSAGAVQKLDYPAITHHGIAIKPNEVYVESNRVYLSLTVKSDRIVDVNSLQMMSENNTLRVGEGSQFRDQSFQFSDSSWSRKENSPFARMEREGMTQLVLTADIPENLLLNDEVPMRLFIEHVRFIVEGEPMGIAYYGPWIFEFTADLRPTHAQARTVALNYAFIGDGELFEATKMTVSPLRTRIIVRRSLPSRLFDRDKQAGEIFSYMNSGNLLGFAVADSSGNRIEITDVESNFDYDPGKPAPSVAEVTFFSDAANNGWDWLKDAGELTVTPYFATIYGPKNDGAGLERYVAADALTIETAPGGTDTAAGKLESFMADFEPEYTLFGALDTRNPYVKPVRMIQTTKNGAVLIIDRVLVTENGIFVSVLIGIPSGNGSAKLLSNFQLDGRTVDVSPRVAYPEGYFKPTFGGGGGGGPHVQLVSEDPPVGVDGIGSALMFDEDYVSAKDPMHVKVEIGGYSLCWDESVEMPYVGSHCYSETGPWIFEFDTDGAELAAKTREIELNESFKVEGYDVSVDRIRFNPMQTILFTSNTSLGGLPYEEKLAALIETDDGTRLRMYRQAYPFAGYTVKTIDPDEITALDKTEKLKLLFCLGTDDAFVLGDLEVGSRDPIDCDPVWSTVIDLK